MGASCFMLVVTALVLTAIGVVFMDPILWPVSYTHLDVYKRQPPIS